MWGPLCVRFCFWTSKEKGRMSKGKDAKKEKKKAPQKSLKEKRAEKRAKKAGL